MKDRLGSFGDIIFSLMLAGIVASYVAIFPTLLRTVGSERGITLFMSFLWVQETPLIQFIAITALWALQARVISKLFVDHVAFVIGYTLMLLWLFGWVMVENIIPVVMASQSMKPTLPSLVTSPSLLLSASFGAILILAIGGLGYHWFWLSRFERYESIRDCSMIAIGVLATGLLGATSIKVETPLDLLQIIVFALGLRLLISVEVDPRALRAWGTAEEQAHQTRVLFAGRVLTALFALSAIGLTWFDPFAHLVSSFFWGALVMFILAVWGLPKQISTVRRIHEASAAAREIQAARATR